MVNLGAQDAGGGGGGGGQKYSGSHAVSFKSVENSGNALVTLELMPL